MKYPATQFKSLTVALKELEPFVRNGVHLQSGRPFENFGQMRSPDVLPTENGKERRSRSRALPLLFGSLKTVWRFQQRPPPRYLYSPFGVPR